MPLDDNELYGDEFAGEGGGGGNRPDPDSEIGRIFDELGFETWDDILVGKGADSDPDHYRPGEYATPEEALLEYYERGLGEYIEIYYDPDCDCYEVYLAYET